MAAFLGMHLSPVKHSSASVTDGQTDRQTDRQTDDGQSAKDNVSLCFAGETKIEQRVIFNVENTLKTIFNVDNYSSGGFAPWAPTRASPWTHWGPQGRPQTPCLKVLPHQKYPGYAPGCKNIN